MSKKIYVVDDDPTIRLIAKTYLKRAGYDVEEFTNGNSLLEYFSEQPADMVLMDVMMPETNGFVLCKKLRMISQVPIIMLSGRNSDLDYATAREMGSNGYFVKPFEPNDLISYVEKIFRQIESPMSHKEAPLFQDSELIEINTTLSTYQRALDKTLEKIQLISDNWDNTQCDSPIERFSGRLKTLSSIAMKLDKLGLSITAENARSALFDIIGIRIISSFANDIKTIVHLIKSIPGVIVVQEKDYIAHPKASGYRSYHIIVRVPIDGYAGIENVPVEFQIRTGAMDFWASLEHRVNYKYNGHVPQHLSDELVNCANRINELDERMYLIHDIIKLINPS